LLQGVVEGAGAVLLRRGTRDVVIKCSDGGVGVGKSILCAHSLAFDSIFKVSVFLPKLQNPGEESKSGCVQLNETQQAVGDLVKAIYTRELPAETDRLLDLVRLSDQYMVSSLWELIFLHFSGLMYRRNHVFCPATPSNFV